MTAQKPTIPGRVSAVVGNLAVVRTGDKVDVYNLNFYRIADEAKSGVERPVSGG